MPKITDFFTWELQIIRFEGKCEGQVKVRFYVKLERKILLFFYFFFTFYPFLFHIIKKCINKNFEIYYLNHHSYLIVYYKILHVLQTLYMAYLLSEKNANSSVLIKKLVAFIQRKIHYFYL